MIKKLDTETFSDFISRGNVVVDFHAEWCGPCKIMAPHFKKASEAITGVRFASLDVDGNQEIAQEYGVMSIPTTIFFKDGEIVDRHTGAMGFADIKQKVEAAFS